MAVSIQPIKASQAHALADYYSQKTKEVAAELRTREEYAEAPQEELEKIAHVQMERARVQGMGGDPDKVEAEIRAAWSAQQAGGSAAYYSTEKAERLVHLRGSRAGSTADRDALEDVFLGRDGEHRLDDPYPKQTEAAARAAGHKGKITADVREALRSGRDPQTGQELTGEAAEKVSAYWRAPERQDGEVTAIDTTFSAPKGVSLLAAFGSDETRESIVDAQIAAVTKVLEFAESEGMVLARRGSQKELLKRRGDLADAIGNAGSDEDREALETELRELNEKSVVVAKLTEAIAKTEMTSREGDPQLHTHMLLSNFVRSSDGKITSLDGRPWHGASAALDAVYLRTLSQELHQRIGVHLEERVLGDKVKLGGVPGIDPALEEKFSTRRMQINESLKERHAEREGLEALMGNRRSAFERAYEVREAGGPQTEEQAQKAEVYALWLESGTSPQAAALATRSSKAEESEDAAVARWRTAPGMPDGDDLLEAAREASIPIEKHELDREALWERMDLDLIEKSASFSAADALTSALRLAPQGVDESEVLAAGREYLHGRSITLETAPSLASRGDEWRQKSSGWTTEHVLAQRSRMNLMAQELSHESVGRFGLDSRGNRPAPGFDNSEMISTAAEMSEQMTLAEEQDEVLRAVVSGQRLTNVQGIAGSGKSHAIRAIATTFQKQGGHVHVLATRAQNASDLGAEVGANSYGTLHAACDEEFGLFETDMRELGLNADQQSQFHSLSKAVDEARLSGDKEAKEQAEQALQRWHEGLPTRAEARSLSDKRAALERADKALRRTNKVASEIGAEGLAKTLGVGRGRRDLYERRQELMEAKKELPHAWGEADHSQRELIIVEEAGMTADDHLEKALEYARDHDNVQLLFVGDYAQLDAVQRSGGFREIQEYVPAVQLNEIRRADAGWEREQQTRAHNLPWDNSEEARAEARNIVGAYEQHDRLISAGSDEEVQTRINEEPSEAVRNDLPQQIAKEKAAQWWMDAREEARAGQQASVEGDAGKPSKNQDDREKTFAVIAPTNSMQAQVSTEIQRLRYDAGELDPNARKGQIEFEGQQQEVQKGEELIFREGVYAAGIKNGWRAEVLAVRPGGWVSVRVTDEHGRSWGKTLSPSVLREGKVALAYSTTVHKAQGQTLDKALYVHDPKNEGFVDRQGTYPAMTRSRESTEVMLVGEYDQAKESLARTMSTSKNGILRQATRENAAVTPEAHDLVQELYSDLGVEPTWADAKSTAQGLAVKRTEALIRAERRERLERAKIHPEIAAERKAAQERREEERRQQQMQQQSRQRAMSF